MANCTWVDSAGRLQVDGHKLFRDKKVIRDIKELKKTSLAGGQNQVSTKTDQVPIKGK